MNPREIIAKRVAKELKSGDVVNLGIGIPTMVANYIDEGLDIILQSENGFVGLGAMAGEGMEDRDVVDAGGRYVTVNSRASFFDSLTSFCMIRGGHVDVTVLGALEVDETGSIANWIVPGKLLTGMGGAMDLVTGAKKVIIAMEHNAKDGGYKIVKKCSLPLTAQNEADMIITEKAVIETGKDGLILREIAPGCSVEDVVASTQASLIIGENIKEMDI
jgi:acetate CoA/acetoacetate CoA-transferase beta subunit